MERRLVKQGRNALTLTLPARWLKDKGLAAGDSVQLEEGNQELVIRCMPMSSHATVEIDVAGQERSLLWHAVLGCYLEGYDRIIVHHDQPVAMQDTSRALVGMVVEDHGPTRTVLSSIIAVPETSIDVLVRRVLHLLAQHAGLLVNVSSGTMDAREMKQQELVLDSTIYYVLRHLVKYQDRKHAYRTFLFLDTIETAADLLSLLAKHVAEDTYLARTVSEHVKEYTHLVAAGDLPALYASLRAFRREVEKPTFGAGLAFSLAELLYNNIGFFLSMNKDEKK
jgi:antitoxin component of MazEF toxin-antitoxin module